MRKSRDVENFLQPCIFYSLLEEIPIECTAKSEYTESTNDIPYAPAGSNLLAVFWSEGNSINLFLGRTLCEEGNYNHQENDEDN